MANNAVEETLELPEWWRRFAESELESRIETDTSKYQRVLFRDWFRTGIVEVYWKAVDAYFAADGRLAIEVLKNFGAGDQAHLDRLFRNKKYPGAENLFATLIAEKIEIAEIPFPQIREAIWQAVAETMQFIRVNYIGPQRGRLDRLTFNLVQSFVLHRDSEAHAKRLLRRDTDDRQLNLKPSELAGSNLLRGLRQQFPDAKLTAERLQSAIEQWLTPYVLMRFGLHGGWGISHEDLA